MMKACLLAIITLFLQLSHGQLIKNAYPTIAPCDPKLLSLIKTYWEENGTPHNPLQTMADSGMLTLVHTSYNYLSSIIKCIYLKFGKDSITTILVPNNGKPALNMTYSAVQDEENVIRFKVPESDSLEYRWNWYPIYLDKRITTIYVCSNVKGVQDVPVMSIMLVKNDKNLLQLPEIDRFYKMVEEWGIQFKHSYGEECVLDKNI